MGWLQDFSATAARTDKLVENDNHRALLAAGLFGEAGSILAELKKEIREQEAYPAYRNKMMEEIGDFLWYFVRMTAVYEQNTLAEFEKSYGAVRIAADDSSVSLFLEFGACTADVLSAVRDGSSSGIGPPLARIWDMLCRISEFAHFSLQDAANQNIRKTESRWIRDSGYYELFDNNFPEEEKIPRRLEIEFREVTGGTKKQAILRCNNLNFGDRLTDNIHDPDGYRFHDVFHFAHAVYLGWSPVIRSILKCKRKSKPEFDEEQDGARAIIIEEAVSAIVFGRAKNLNYFDGIRNVDFNLLKTIQEFVEGYEVDAVPLWQWEKAIIEGYAIFRELSKNCGGFVSMDLNNRTLKYKRPL